MSSTNGHGAHPQADDGVPTFYRTESIERIAWSFGQTVAERVTVRLPARCWTELERWIHRYGKSGRLLVDYSQGQEVWITWEETRDVC
jgi:hypothetical protein